jgi:YbbR domain-containing protein
MSLAPIRWIVKNLSTLLLAFILAIVVWVSAVINVDPNVEAPLTRQIPIQLMGEDPGQKIMNDYERNVSLTLLAPQSVWNQVNTDPDSIRAWVDLSTLPEGEFTVPVHVDIDQKLAKITQQEPTEITIRREVLVSKSLPVVIRVSGGPPLGYQADTPTANPQEIIVSGPESLVDRVQEIRSQVEIGGATETVVRTLSLTAVDEDERPVSGITLTPTTVQVTAPITLLGGYRNVVVKVVPVGNVASGYRLTNYLPNPASVIVFSSNPRLVEQLPGYVETLPLDLTGADDDFEALLELNLPEGVVSVTDSRILVQVSIAAIETSMSISLPVEITGLLPGLEAVISPSIVDVLLTGPVPVLNILEPADIRVKIDLENYVEGVHQLIPVVDFLPADVQKVSILPATVEVTIRAQPTPTVTRAFPPPGIPSTPTTTPTATPRP